MGDAMTHPQKTNDWNPKNDGVKDEIKMSFLFQRL